MRKSTKNFFLLTMGFFIPLGSCLGQNTRLKEELMSGVNLINHINNADFNGFSWLNKPETYEFTEDSFSILAPPESDFFNNPEDGKVTGTAPFLYTEVTGDFIAITQVQPDFTSLWNAGALMVYWDSEHWIKFGFEYSDATGPSIVSVVTRQESDDANGVILGDTSAIWLKLIRKNNLYSMHWSRDGKNYKMARLAAMPNKDIIKIGIEAQCPAGQGAKHKFSFFSLESKTVADIRKGE
ncbi:MAG: DUF1349 domain-containing protein [Eudoraea sp.]|nr:DUF1349 domain-containing protein [Eudoraea sp.]